MFLNNETGRNGCASFLSTKRKIIKPRIPMIRYQKEFLTLVDNNKSEIEIPNKKKPLKSIWVFLNSIFSLYGIRQRTVAIPIGTLIKKIHLQVSSSTKNEPNTGPTIDEMAHMLLKTA